MSVTIAIIGSQGRMGAMLCEAWRARHSVRCVDRAAPAHSTLGLTTPGALDAAAVTAAVREADAVFLCVPAPVMAEVLDIVTPAMHEGQILADVCSVKMLPMQHMEERFAGPVVGTHPLFGPDNERTGAKVAVVPGVNASSAHLERITNLFAELGATCFTTTAEKHDKAVAVSQSLHFAVSAAYFAAAAAHEGLDPYLTPSFNRYREAAQKVLTVNAPMFCAFSEANPQLPDALETVRALLEEAKNGSLPEIAAKAASWYAE
ncbi:MAG: hypothetical protein DELT_02718 [Desulfovibrio sp.]